MTNVSRNFEKCHFRYQMFLMMTEKLKILGQKYDRDEPNENRYEKKKLFCKTLK